MKEMFHREELPGLATLNIVIPNYNAYEFIAKEEIYLEPGQVQQILDAKGPVRLTFMGTDSEQTCILTSTDLNDEYISFVGLAADNCYAITCLYDQFNDWIQAENVRSIYEKQEVIVSNVEIGGQTELTKEDYDAIRNNWYNVILQGHLYAGKKIEARISSIIPTDNVKGIILVSYADPETQTIQHVAHEYNHKGEFYTLEYIF